MEELLREHLGEIALLIYILFPLLKRLLDRRKKKTAKKPSEAEARAGKAAEQAPAPTPASEPVPARPAPLTEKPEAQPDFLGLARMELERIDQESTRLLRQAEANPRLARLVPALREDLAGRLQAIDLSLQGAPTLSTIVQDRTALRGLEELLRHLGRMARQRMLAPRLALAQADQMADDCYAPLIELARARNLGLTTSEPVPLSGDWDWSIMPRLASTRVAPLRLPPDFEHSLWRWPAIAAEVGRDFYYSLKHLEQDLHERLGLPYGLEVPASDREVDGRWLAQLFGVWLPEIFADLMGTLLLGPAYVEMIRRVHRNPGSPQRTAAVFRDGRLIDEQPPARLRIYMAVRTLHHLGRHQEADSLWEQWEAEHPDMQLYFLPLGGQWAGLSDQALHSLADTMVDTLVLSPWPELEGFQLMNVPGLAYLHADHAEVERLMGVLARGGTARADSRRIISAAVLAAAAQPTLHDSILEAARRSIEGIEMEEREPQRRAIRPLPSASIGRSLRASLRRPSAIREAIVVGAALSPRRWRGSR
ncbi:MAG: hypothetical protein AMJ62_11320 [Myxococcales bacterium SG8_38]|nr:MAG: hypothetical protein AMJ62_11320 [Myxococcales bacterium SG8_38]